MRVIPAGDLAECLDYASLVDRIRDYFRGDGQAPKPLRFPVWSGASGEPEVAPGAHEVGDGDQDALLTVAPAWRDAGYIGVKVATDFPANVDQGLPRAMAAYLLLSGRTGEPLALIDGTELTHRAAAATSALAARYLARMDCERLLMVGAGPLATHLIRAHATQRPICNVLVWDAESSRASHIARRLNRSDFRVDATTDLENAVRGAHVVSRCPGTRAPEIEGPWLQPGQHVDLAGGLGSGYEGIATAALARARVFVDSRERPAAGAGETSRNVQGDLFDLSRGSSPGRNRYQEITLFRTAGSGLADLAAAKLAFERV